MDELLERYKQGKVDNYADFVSEIKSKLYEKANNSNLYWMLSQIVRKRPELAIDVLYAVRVGVNNGQYYACSVLSDVVRVKPELLKNALDVANIALSNSKMTSYHRMEECCDVYGSIVKIVGERPELAQDIFDFVNDDLSNSKKHDEYSLNGVNEILLSIIRVNKELAGSVLKAVSDGFSNKLKEGDVYHLDYAYYALSEVLKAKPELAEEVLYVIQKGKGVYKGWGKARCKAFDILCDIMRINPKLERNVLNYAKLGFDKDKGAYDDWSLSMLSYMVKNNSELTDEVIDFLKNTVANGIEKGKSLVHMYSTLLEIVKARPELAEKVFDVCKVGFVNAKNATSKVYYSSHGWRTYEGYALCEVYKDFSDLVRSRPKLAKNVLDALKGGLSHKGKGYYHCEESYEMLSHIIKANPDLSKDVFKIVNGNIDYCNNTDDLVRNYIILSDIIIAKPELAEEVMKAYKFCLSHKKNIKTTRPTENAYGAGYRRLSRIVRERPELAQDVLDALNVGLANSNDFSLSNVCETLSYIVKAKPELAEDALSVCKTCLARGNGKDLFEETYLLLSNIAKAKPELAKDVLEVYKISLLNKDYKISFNEDCKLLSCILNAEPELVRDVLKVYKTCSANKKNDNSFNGFYDMLSDVVKEKNEVAVTFYDFIVNEELIADRVTMVSAEKRLAEIKERLSKVQHDTKQQQEDKDKSEKMFLDGAGISDMLPDERQKLFEKSQTLMVKHSVMQEVSLATMCRCYMAETDKKAKLEFLKTLYQIRKGCKTNKEKNEMADTFARVIDKAPDLKKDENLVALSKRDTVVSQPTKQVRRQVESKGKKR